MPINIYLHRRNRRTPNNLNLVPYWKDPYIVSSAERSMCLCPPIFRSSTDLPSERGNKILFKPCMRLQNLNSRATLFKNQMLSVLVHETSQISEESKTKRHSQTRTRNSFITTIKKQNSSMRYSRNNIEGY
jgi:hypothetical protein